MRTINLNHPDEDVKIIKFPDGQQDIRIKPSDEEEVTIISRLNNFMDYELIACACASLRRTGVEKIHLYSPYIVGARSDRDFTKGKGGTSYLIDVLKPALDHLDFKSITVIDPHSEVMGAINKIKMLDNQELVRFATDDIDDKDICVVSPDAGANKKVYDLLSSLGLKCELIQADKHRDVLTGDFQGFKVPILDNQIDKTLVWVDDICDGGGTFIGEAIEANKNGHKGKKYLVVTHGIFSKGFSDLTKYFDGIYCTNSYSNIGDLSGNELEKTYTKQLKVI